MEKEISYSDEEFCLKYPNDANAGAYACADADVDADTDAELMSK